MKERQIAVCGREADYAKRFAEFANSRRDSLFTVHGFNGLRRAYGVYEGASGGTCFSFRRSAFPSCPWTGISERCILLSEAEYREDETYPAVCRYQSCSQVLRQALAIYAEQTPKVLGVALRTERMKRIGIYSPVGRAGKTSFALALGKEGGEEKEDALSESGGVFGIRGALTPTRTAGRCRS